MEPDQKYKSSIVNLARRIGKEIVTISKSAKKGKIHEGMLGWKNQSETADRVDNAIWRDKSKDIGERRET